MDKNTPVIIGGVIILALLVGGMVIFGGSSGGNNENVTGELDSFARCISDSGATFYGAFWCPHCQAQKKLFGSSVKFLPYTECSTPDGNGQLQVCKDAGVTNYPTWQFADGSRLTGEIPLAQLAEKTSCVLPGNENADSALPSAGESSSAGG